MIDLENATKFWNDYDHHFTGDQSKTIQLKDQEDLFLIAQKLTDLTSTNLSAGSEILKRKLIHQLRQEGRVSSSKSIFINKRNTWGGVIALCTILIAVGLIIPPIQAFAIDMFQRFGNYIISNQPSDAEDYIATMQSGTPTPTPDPDKICSSCTQSQVVGKLSIMEASSKAGFSVSEPTWIPAGYKLETRDVLFTGQTITVDTSYYIELDPPINGEQFRGIIAIDQTFLLPNAQPWQKDIGEVPVIEVQVNDHPAIWLEQLPIYPFQDETGQWNVAKWNQLIWEEDGYHFTVQTNMSTGLISYEDMVHIAESLRP